MSKQIVEKHLSTGFYRGWTRTPWVIVLHYTEGYSAQQTFNTLRKRKLSVHFTIERDGTLYRMVSDSNRGIHAGYGRWCGKANMNHHAFGIEMVNFGKGDGKYEGTSPHYVYRHKDETYPELVQSDTEWYRDETYKSSKGNWITTRVITKQEMDKFPDHRSSTKDFYWTKYPEEQIESVCWQVWEWMKLHKILPENVIGHEHVTPHRKLDPGPAFPWEELNSYILDKAKKEMPELLDINFNKKLRIKAAQSHCARMGLPVGDIDGLWGKKTSGAINTAVKKYGSLYGFNDLTVSQDNITEIALALKKVPGFDPGRR